MSSEPNSSAYSSITRNAWWTISASKRSSTDGGDYLSGDGALDGSPPASGDDFIHGDAGSDYIEGNAGADKVWGDVGDDVLYGDNSPYSGSGGTGNDILDGGVGADRMTGGDGDDVYYVDNTGDVVDETGTTGIDKVYASISFNLSGSTHLLGDVENLVLTGTANLTGTGNVLNNAVTGNSGANVLNGAAGNDSLVGNAGNDKLTGSLGADRLSRVV